MLQRFAHATAIGSIDQNGPDCDREVRWDQNGDTGRVRFQRMVFKRRFACGPVANISFLPGFEKERCKGFLVDF